MSHSIEEELARMREVNLTLRRQLERARRDALLYAAQFCEDHYMEYDEKWNAVPTDGRDHAGQMYAAKLREIAG